MPTNWSVTMSEGSGVPIRKPSEWFVKADDRLLEFLVVEGAATPTKISEDERVSVPRSYVNQRLLLLKNAGFVETKIGRGVYELTEMGESYLNGDSDFRNLDRPESDDE